MKRRIIVPWLMSLSFLLASAGDLAKAQGTSLVINEFVASNQRSLVDGDGNTPDWIELYNGGTASVSLAGWSLTDDWRSLRKWTFPSQAALRAGGYLVVFASGQSTDDHVDKKGNFHTNFALDRDGEYLALVDPQSTIVHEFAPSFPPQQTDISYGLSSGELCYFAATTPGRANGQGFLGVVAKTYHSQERGFYDDAFSLRIFCDTLDVVIRYTLDGSQPTEQNGFVYDHRTTIPILTTTVVRSAAFRTGWIPAGVTTHTYIFLDDVARQPSQPAGWPSDWGYDSEVKGIVPADYAMDPRVVDNTFPGYSVREALLAVPTLSISMLLDDFISDATGIYANPQGRAERECSIEYILPDGGAGFQCGCKIETHGGSSRRPWRMQKHSMRLTFTSLYGPAKLEYPLFPESDVDEFNQLVLRGGFCDSWGLVSWDPSRYRPNDSQYIRDTWMKESLRDMGQPSTSGSFVHLYVNGLYFGLYNLSERIAGDFCADHLGGEPEDWEVNADFGSGARWREMMAADPSTFAGYAQILEHLDVEDFADYVLLHLYADAEDWPHHNGYSIVNAISGDGRFRFVCWDQEIVLDYHGRAASRVDNSSGVGALFQKMRASEEFRLLFADRVYKHCFHGGALSIAGSQDRYRRIASWIDKAIVAESARWGDTQMSTPYGNDIQQPSPLTDINHIMYPPAPHGPDYYFTREDSWIVERDNVIQNYIPAIHNTANSYALLNLLRTRNLYPTVDPPAFSINGTPQHGGPVTAGDRLTMTNPNTSGMVYYTLDGADPRVPGAGSAQTEAGVLVPEDAAKRVLIPTADIGQGWRNQPFDDSSWMSGTGGVGYERSTGYEPYFKINVNAAMYNVNTSCYVRIPFTLAAADLQNLADLTLKVRYDDGFIAYLNGVEVARDMFAGTPQWNSIADDSHPDEEAVTLTNFNIAAHANLLRQGANLLAIHALNASPTSSDFLISAELVTGVTAAPATSDPSISPTAVPYTDAIPLTTTTHIRARILDRGQWSALAEATYELTADH
ncbi:MAG: chitobiase/beta-hexosaminidase C-terminal domain-containing protein [Sedimentisphaerales bacterium]|nr:chitobiase/beta-hexosaminidase C-terminal domain-containing protein [Sedimentisphaerales bacterium]